MIITFMSLSSEQQARIQSLPKTLEEALDALERDHDYLTKNGVFPERLIQIWLEKKERKAGRSARFPIRRNSAPIMIYRELQMGWQTGTALYEYHRNAAPERAEDV